MEFVAATFEGAVLKECHNGLLRYQLPRDSFDLAVVFQKLENGKKALGLEDYSVTQTTLEDVFCNFAQHQSEEDDDDVRAPGVPGGGLVSPLVSHDDSMLVLDNDMDFEPWNEDSNAEYLQIAPASSTA